MANIGLYSYIYIAYLILYSNIYIAFSIGNRLTETVAKRDSSHCAQLHSQLAQVAIHPPLCDLGIGNRCQIRMALT